MHDVGVPIYSFDAEFESIIARAGLQTSHGTFSGFSRCCHSARKSLSEGASVFAYGPGEHTPVAVAWELEGLIMQ